MKTPKCYTWLESCGSHLSGGIKEKIMFSILQSVRFSRTLRTDIFLYTEKLSVLNGIQIVSPGLGWSRIGSDRLGSSRMVLDGLV